MPIFTYQCPDCGLRFGAMQVSETPSEKAPCKKCKKPATLQRSAASFKFAHQPTAPAPQNSGVSAIDHDVDVIIGRSAERNLREFQKRQDHKRRIMAAENVSGHYLSRLDDGDYFVMTEQERVAAKKGRLVHQEAIKKIQAWKTARQRTGQGAAS